METSNRLDQFIDEAEGAHYALLNLRDALKKCINSDLYSDIERAITFFEEFDSYARDQIITTDLYDEAIQEFDVAEFIHGDNAFSSEIFISAYNKLKSFAPKPGAYELKKRRAEFNGEI